jgi:hypothetical protein
MLLVALLVTLLAVPPWARPAAAAQEPPGPSGGERKLSTPELLAADVASGVLDQDTAYLYLGYALADYSQLPAAYSSDVPWDGTLPLLALQEAVAEMPAGLERAAVEKLLTGVCSTSTAPLPNVTDTAHFHVQYDTIAAGLTVGDYTASLETTWSTEVTSFGWAAPPVLASNPPPGNRYHVRIDALAPGLYGFVSSAGIHAGPVGDNPNSAWNDGDAYATCMVLNRDYGAFPGTPLAALQATAAHEFNHSLQFGYGAITGANSPDDSFVEGGASWMEDEVFDSSNDNYNYLWPTFEMCMGEYTASPYPYWFTFRGLTERYGAGTAGTGEQVMQDFWEETSKSASSNMLEALNTALVNKGTTLADAYHVYAVAAKFNKTCGGGYVYPYCFEEAVGYLATAGPTAVHGAIAAPGGSYTGSLADNYALNWISLPASGAYDVTLKNTSPGGQLRGSVVCDTGSALAVTALPSVAGPGGLTTLSSYNASGCSSVVAVITNQAQTAADPASCTARSYELTAGGSTPAQKRVYLPLIWRPAVVVPLVNGNFESGSTGWTEHSYQGYALILPGSSLPGGVTPHGGNWVAWLGGADNEISYVRQQVTVPVGSPFLGYWHWIASLDSCGFDFGGVIVNDATVVDVYNLCTSTNTGGWVKHVVNLSAYAGQTVSLQIRAETDISENSNLFVDDVAFQAAASPRDAPLSGAPAPTEVESARTKAGLGLTPGLTAGQEGALRLY